MQDEVKALITQAYGEPPLISGKGWEDRASKAIVIWHGAKVGQARQQILEEIKTFYNKPRYYHYTCWASAAVLVRDEWGEEPTYKCHCYNGDFNCGCRKCPWEQGIIKGDMELQDFERHQNSVIDDILRTLNKEQGELVEGNK